MMELVEANWILLVAALLIGIAVAWWIFVANRRTRVSGERKDVLDEGADPAARNQALIDAEPVARTDAVSKANEDLAIADGDDLTRIKGVGAKLRDLLNSLGVAQFSQIAEWTDKDIDRIDAQLGRFEGRIRRDDWVGQAKLLAADDTEGYARKFGNL